MKVVVETYQGKVINIILSEPMPNIEFYEANLDNAHFTSPTVIVDPKSCESSKDIAIISKRYS